MYYLQNEDFTIKRDKDKIVFNWKDVASISYNVDMAQEWLVQLIDTINNAVNKEQGILMEIGMRTICSVEFAKDVMNAVKTAISDIVEGKH